MAQSIVICLMGLTWCESEENSSYSIRAFTVLLLITDNQSLIAPSWQLMNCNRYYTLHLDIEGYDALQTNRKTEENSWKQREGKMRQRGSSYR